MKYFNNIAHENEKQNTLNYNIGINNLNIFYLNITYILVFCTYMSQKKSIKTLHLATSAVAWRWSTFWQLRLQSNQIGHIRHPTLEFRLESGVRPTSAADLSPTPTYYPTLPTPIWSQSDVSMSSGTQRVKLCLRSFRLHDSVTIVYFQSK